MAEYPGTPPVTIRMPSPLKTALDKWAIKEGRTRSEAIRLILYEYLESVGYYVDEE